MKLLKIFVTIAIAAVLYSCGNNESKTKQDCSNDSLKQTKSNCQGADDKKVKCDVKKCETACALSKDEIKQGMDNAVKYFQKRNSYFSVLLEEEGFTSPKAVEKKWGKAKSKDEKNLELDYGDGLVFNKLVTTMEYDYFNLVMENCNEKFPEDAWGIAKLESKTSGFGFGGIYVGVPECNKEYLSKLFKPTKVEEKTDNGVKHLSIVLPTEGYREIDIVLDENGLVKSVKYEASICTD